MAKTHETDAAAINIIRKGTTIQGDINCTGDIRIDGNVKGSLSSDGKVVVGPSGVIEGDVVCKNADISGSLNATLSVKELLMLKSSANIVGDIKTSKLSIEPGANFTGSCNMGGVVKGISDDKQPAVEQAQTA